MSIGIVIKGDVLFCFQIRALSDVLARPIEVVQADGVNIVVGENLPGQKLILSYVELLFLADNTFYVLSNYCGKQNCSWISSRRT